jgi:hypothetical protein
VHRTAHPLLLLQIIARKLTYTFQQHGTTMATATVLTGTPNAAGTNATANVTAVIRYDSCPTLLQPHSMGCEAGQPHTQHDS